MMRSLISLSLFFCAVVGGLAQGDGSLPASESRVVLVSLFRPVYPPLALQARISGDVELTLTVRQDGSVESAVAISGHPMLKKTALDSAEQSKFECRGCTKQVTSYTLVYAFQLGPTIYCATTAATSSNNQQAKTYPYVLQSQNRVTLVDAPVGTCDLPAELPWKVRSPRCLYLWRCGRSG
jgi:TonB family protein